MCQRRRLARVVSLLIHHEGRSFVSHRDVLVLSRLILLLSPEAWPPPSFEARTLLCRFISPGLPLLLGEGPSDMVE